MGMIGNEVLENRMRGWYDVGNFDQPIGDAGREEVSNFSAHCS